jgi:hypothetical protein
LMEIPYSHLQLLSWHDQTFRDDHSIDDRDGEVVSSPVSLSTTGGRKNRRIKWRRNDSKVEEEINIMNMFARHFQGSEIRAGGWMTRPSGMRHSVGHARGDYHGRITQQMQKLYREGSFTARLWSDHSSAFWVAVALQSLDSDESYFRMDQFWLLTDASRKVHLKSIKCLSADHPCYRFRHIDRKSVV